jgi:hypothetical protein
MSYTKGPWTILTDNKKASTVVITNWTGSNQPLTRAAFENFICDTNTGHHSQKECEANAKLIAAAPTMYEFILTKAKKGDLKAKNLLETLDLL